MGEEEVCHSMGPADVRRHIECGVLGRADKVLRMQLARVVPVGEPLLLTRALARHLRL